MFAGNEAKIAAMVERTLAFSIAYAKEALFDPRRLGREVLRRDYLERRDGSRSASMNDVMFATFCLAYVDIAFRVGSWLRGQQLDWRHAMVLVSGQSGRPTAGVTWSSNNICNLIWQASDKELPRERLFVARTRPALPWPNCRTRRRSPRSSRPTATSGATRRRASTCRASCWRTIETHSSSIPRSRPTSR